MDIFMKCNNFDPLRLGVIAASFVVLGDLLELILAISAFQEQQTEKCNNKIELQLQIKQLQEQLDKLCS